MTGTGIALLWLPLAGAAVPPGAYVTAVAEPLTLGALGDAPQVFSRGDGGWWVLAESDGALVRTGVGAGLTLDRAGQSVDVGGQSCESHRVAACDDGGWLHVCSSTGAAAEDTAWAFRHDAAWSLETQALLADQDATALHGRAPLICGGALWATVFQPASGDDGSVVALGSDLGLLASPFSLAADPTLQGGGLWLDAAQATLGVVTVDPGADALVLDLHDAATGAATQARHVVAPLPSNERLIGAAQAVRLGDPLLVVHTCAQEGLAWDDDAGDLCLGVLDARGTLLEHVALTDWGGGGARDPHLAVQDETLLVVADVGGETVGLRVTLDLAALAAGTPVPVARAGADQEVLVAYAAETDGSDSYDPDGDVLTYVWSLIYQPGDAGLEASDISGVDAPQASFIPPVAGNYELLLEVTSVDGTASDSVVLVAVDSLDTGVDSGAPVADAGPDRVIYLGDVAQIDGSASVDPDGDLLIWSWGLATVPDGSQLTDADLAGVATSQVLLTPDVEGAYTLTLVLSDGTSLGSDQVQVTALSRDGGCEGCGLAGGTSGGPWPGLLALLFALRLRAPAPRWPGRSGARQR